MATAASTDYTTTDAAEPVDHGNTLIWLDDSAQEDEGAHEVFSSFFDNVFTSADPEVCLELVESMDASIPCVTILISGKYGQMLVRDRLQPLKQVKDIYVFCFDTAKHGRWAQTCDKVRCVFSDIEKIIQCMQFDMQSAMDASAKHDEPLPLPAVATEPQPRERFTDDYNFFDHLALKLLLHAPDDGAEDFVQYCQAHIPSTNEAEPTAATPESFFDPDQTIQEWYRPNLRVLDITSYDLTKLWTLRWFLRRFHQQLSTAQEDVVTDQTNLTVHYGTCLTDDELGAIKHRVGQIIILTEFIRAYAQQQPALEDTRNDPEQRHRTVFEISIDTASRATVPYARIASEQLLLWFGARCSVRKIEYFDEDGDPYWCIGLVLCPTMDAKPATQTLYDYYSKELSASADTRHAFGRVLMHQGAYRRAEEWFQTSDHYHELAEVAIRQGHFERATRYLEQLSDDDDMANLLRAYLSIATADGDWSRTRTLLLRIFSDANEKLIRARANVALGFTSLILAQQVDEALEYFTLGNEALQKVLPTNHPTVAKSFIGLGYAHYCRDDLDAAKKCFQTAFHIQKQSLKYNHPDLAATRTGLAHCLANDGQTPERALNETEYALEILLGNYQSEHHPQVAATQRDLDRLRKGKALRVREVLLDYI